MCCSSHASSRHLVSHIVPPPWAPESAPGTRTGSRQDSDELRGDLLNGTTRNPPFGASTSRNGQANVIDVVWSTGNTSTCSSRVTCVVIQAPDGMRAILRESENTGRSRWKFSRALGCILDFASGGREFSKFGLNLNSTVLD
jgi:hypothetical protein